MICHLLTQVEISTVSIFYCILKICFSILTLTNLNNSPLRSFWLYSEKIYLRGAGTYFWKKEFALFLLKVNFSKITLFYLFSYLRNLFFITWFQEVNQTVFMVGCQVRYILNFTTIFQYWRNGELGRNYGYKQYLCIGVRGKWSRTSGEVRM